MLPPPIKKVVISFELRTLVQLYGLAHYYIPRKQQCMRGFLRILVNFKLFSG